MVIYPNSVTYEVTRVRYDKWS